MKNIFKKLSFMILIFAGVLLLVSCEETNTPNVDIDDELNVYYLNDTHGAILNKGDEMGLSKIGNLIIDEFDNKPENTVFITGGDMFQGQLISNMSKGAAMVEVLNEMQLDAFVLGNHEFDWGIDIVLEYFNKDALGVKANFPALAANIFNKSDDKLIDHVEPYTIVKRNNVKIGIIGVMGYGLESSIKEDRIQDYYFADPTPIIKQYTKELREEKGVDIVLVTGHASGESLNSEISGLMGSYKIDAIFNGHNHRNEVGFELNTPYIQSDSNGRVVGHLHFKYENINGNITIDETKTKLKNLSENDDQRLSKPNSKVDLVIEKYYAEVKDLYEEVIITTGQYMNRTDLSQFITRAMVSYLGVDIGIQNNGGTRASFDENQDITAADIFQVFPFDNELMVYESYGSNVGSFYGGQWLTSYTSVSYFESSKTYKVATNDYVLISNIDQALEGTIVSYGDLYEFLVIVIKDIKASGNDILYANSPFNPITTIEPKNA